MISRYWHTLKHLGPGQIAYRILRILPARKPSSRPPPPPAAPPGELAEPVAREPAFEPPDRFLFLNRGARVAEADDWSRSDVPLLWLYHLHYFHDLTARGAGSRAAELADLILRWIRENPPLRRPAWDPYPTSLRIVSWVKWALRVRPLPDEAVASLARQARHLSRYPERQHRANHLLANAKALVFAGCYFSGNEGASDGANEGEGWRRQGLRILETEIPEQILHDGGHFERSPGYHALVLEDLLDLVAILRAYGHPVPGTLTRAVGPMRAWARLMTHPDGGPAQLNDTALDQAPAVRELEAYADRLGLEGHEPDASHDPDTWERLESDEARAVLLPHTGYARVESGPVTAFLDMAPLGPDYNPAHGHADTLTFELSVENQRAIVDPGVSTYEAGPERAVERGTPAHNTVCLDGRDSSEVWASFRVARRARVPERRIDVTQHGALVARAAHDGYVRQRLAGLHARRWRFHQGGMTVEDRLEGSGTHRVESGFLLHPDVDPELVDGPGARLALPSGSALTVELDPALGWSLEPARWHPGFGRAVDTLRLVGRARSPLPLSLEYRFDWR